jgi:hypothetical protein
MGWVVVARQRLQMLGERGEAVQLLVLKWV